MSAPISFKIVCRGYDPLRRRASRRLDITFRIHQAINPRALIPASINSRAASPRLIFSISESLSSLVRWFVVILNDTVSASLSFIIVSTTYTIVFNGFYSIVR